MGRAIGAVWHGIRDVYDDLFQFVGMNLLCLIPWLALSYILGSILFVVILGVVSFGREAPPTEVNDLYPYWMIFLGALVIIAPNPGTAGMHYYANRKVNDERVEFGIFWEGLKLYWKRAFVLFLISMGGISLLLVNIIFYLTRGDQALGVVAMIFIWILLIWLMMQMYALPLLMEQESKSIRLVLRNAAVLTLSNPGFSIVLFILLMLLSVLSIGFTILVALLGGALVAVIEQHAVITLLERYRTSTGS